MKHYLIFIMLVSMLVLSITPIAAQGTTPDITSFSTSYTSIGRDALTNRTARIPVSWATVNRPLSANLYFEQVLPDNSTINVELPRLNPYVASSGQGIAAPILPGGNATTIRLRVTLKNLFNNAVLDTAEITLPIVNGSGGAGTGDIPSLTVFEVPAGTTISQAELNAQTARIPVRWTAINRPITAHLIFEQVLTNGTVVNVELPRPFLWVNSSDRGTVAPVAPGGNATSLTLRVRLVDLLFGRNYDVRYIYVPIQGQAAQPTFTTFTSAVTTIDRQLVANGTALIGVNWSLANRPADTNIVFEQVLPNGTVRNAELPRDVLIVPSSGIGVVNAVLPTGTVTDLVYQVRLVLLNSNTTLASAQLTVRLVDYTPENNTQVVTGDACYTGNFSASRGINVGDRAQILRFNNGESLKVYLSPSLISSITSELGESMTVRITDGPTCYRSTVNFQTWRFWRIDAENTLLPVTGWVLEYLDNDPATAGGFVFTMQEIPNTSNHVAFSAFTVTPTTVSDIQVDSTLLNIAWQTNNAVTIRIEAAGYVVSIPNAPTGSYNLPLADVNFTGDTLEVRVTAFDSNNNTDARTQTITITNTRPVCQNEWQMDVDTTECPSPSTSSTGAYQLFDRGFMVWNQGSVSMMVFYNDGTMAQFADTWNGAEYTIDGTPPAGKYAPERGFGYLWTTQPSVRSSLGWGAAPEVNHTVVQQATISGGATYITLPEGRVVRFGAGRWEFVD
jgi:hypothetical protein